MRCTPPGQTGGVQLHLLTSGNIYLDSFWYYTWNCSQFEQNQNFTLLLFCWNNFGDILNFKSARLKVNSLPFYKNAFYIQIASKRIFQWMGASASALARAHGARTPIQWKKFVMKRFQCKNRFCEKVRNLPWVGLIWNSKCLQYQFSKKAEK